MPLVGPVELDGSTHRPAASAMGTVKVVVDTMTAGTVRPAASRFAMPRGVEARESGDSALLRARRDDDAVMGGHIDTSTGVLEHRASADTEVGITG